MSFSEIVSRKDAGKCYLDGSTIIWDATGNEPLKINISEIRVIGEYTTIHPIHRNEWFLVFVLDEDNSLQISFYADGMDRVLTQLSEALNTSLQPKLGLATDFQSYTIWPEDLQDIPLYELKIKETKTWLDRFRARLGFGYPVEFVFSDAVKEKLSKAP